MHLYGNRWLPGTVEILTWPSNQTCRNGRHLEHALVREQVGFLEQWKSQRGPPIRRVVTGDILNMHLYGNRWLPGTVEILTWPSHQTCRNGRHLEHALVREQVASWNSGNFNMAPPIRRVATGDILSMHLYGNRWLPGTVEISTWPSNQTCRNGRHLEHALVRGTGGFPGTVEISTWPSNQTCRNGPELAEPRARPGTVASPC